MMFLLPLIDVTGKMPVWSEFTFPDRFATLVQNSFARTGGLTGLIDASVATSTGLGLAEKFFSIYSHVT